MAQSRLERIGTIYSRTKSLLRGGAMKEEDKPIWYAIYEAFPPKVEPRYDRPATKIPIREIFYKEDIVRAKFQKDYKNVISTTVMNSKAKTRTQRFISIYQDLEKSGLPEEELYPKAVEAYLAQIESMRNQAGQNLRDKENDDKKTEKINIDMQKLHLPAKTEVDESFAISRQVRKSRSVSPSNEIREEWYLPNKAKGGTGIPEFRAAVERVGEVYR